MGNIASVTQNGKKTAYVYDALGQLIRVNDKNDTTSGTNGTTWVYMYDQGGNILSKKRYAYTTGTVGTALETDTYSYTDSNWKDKLTAYSGTAITYDEIGNPLSDGTWNYTWQNGRQLRQMSKTGETVCFEYNEDGLRTKKTATSTGVTEYTLHGKNIVHMTQGGHALHFYYDAQGKPSIVIYDGTAYGYLHNLQGDVVALVDGAGTMVVEYMYDAWGKPTGKTGTLASTLGTVQPFRYRGYVYDEENECYYLRSRYYRPELCRFVSADTLIKGNLYCYCYNSPNSLTDRNGHDAAIAGAWTASMWWLTLVDGVLPIGDIIYGVGVLITGTIGAAAIYESASTINYSAAKANDRTKTLADVQIRMDDSGYRYRLAYINEYGELVKVGKEMTLSEAAIALGVAGSVNLAENAYTYDRGKSSDAQRDLEHRGNGYWGVYANSQRAAKALAVLFGGSDRPEVHGSGMYGHYHDRTHTFHIWYGGKLTY